MIAPLSATRLLIVASLWLSSVAAGADYLALTGAELYGRFCASCHGTSGRGDGPVSQSFTVEVPDLTLISRRQGGEFPRERIEKIIDGRFIIGAHGTREMPIWGEEFMHAAIGDPDAERATEVIIRRLLEHIRSLQRPAISEKRAN